MTTTKKVPRLYERQLYMTENDRNPDPIFHEKEAMNIIYDINGDSSLRRLMIMDGSIFNAYRHISESLERAGDMSRQNRTKTDYYLAAYSWIKKCSKESSNMERLRRKLGSLRSAKRD